jgi:hypothetical protein
VAFRPEARRPVIRPARTTLLMLLGIALILLAIALVPH